MTEEERSKLIAEITDAIKTWSIEDLQEYVIDVMENSLELLSDDELKEEHESICG